MSPGGRPRLNPDVAKTRDKMTPKERGLKRVNLPAPLHAALLAAAHARHMSLVAYLEWLHSKAPPL